MYTKVIAGITLSATLITSTAAATCTAKATISGTDSWITVTQDGEQIGRSESMQCITPTDPNMIDAGLEHKVAMHVACGGPSVIE